MNYYKKKYLSYTWPVYALILVLSFFLFYGIFEIKNNYNAKEKLSVFICGIEVNKNDKYELIESKLKDKGIKQLYMTCYDYENKNYPTILAVKGYYGSDILILDEFSYSLWESGGYPYDISDEYLHILTNKDVLRCGSNNHLNAIKIYDYLDIEYNNLINQDVIVFDTLETNFYLVINSRSVHIEDGVITDFIKYLIN